MVVQHSICVPMPLYTSIGISLRPQSHRRHHRQPHNLIGSENSILKHIISQPLHDGLDHCIVGCIRSTGAGKCSGPAPGHFTWILCLNVGRAKLLFRGSTHGRPISAHRMDNIDDTVVTSVLTDALNRYMKYLEVEQELHERSQPHQGKDAQTDTDLARIEYFHARTLAVDSCLQVVDRIAENVKRWVRGEDDVQDVERGKHKENGGAEGLRLEALEENLISFDGQDFPSTDEYPKPLWQEDEPFINPLTGQWVTVVNSNSAGPSNTPVYDAFSRNLGSDWPLKVRPSLICPESATPVYDEFSRNSGSDWPLKVRSSSICQKVFIS